MSGYDNLYNKLNQAQEARKRNNFNAIMNSLEINLIKDLNEAYASNNPEKYKNLTDNMKAKGVRIFRNSDGKHKVDLTNFMWNDNPIFNNLDRI